MEMAKLQEVDVTGRPTAENLEEAREPVAAHSGDFLALMGAIVGLSAGVRNDLDEKMEAQSAGVRNDLDEQYG